MAGSPPLTHDEMVAKINAGGSVSFAFKIITRAQDVPTDAEITSWYIDAQNQYYMTKGQADAAYAPLGGGGTTLDQIPAPVADVSMNSHKLRNLAAPISGNDAVRLTDLLNQRYVTNYKQPVRATTTNTIALTGQQTVDGVALVAGDRILVRNQGTGTDAANGIYVVATGAWQRAVDAAAPGGLLGGAFLVVNEGSLYRDTTWELTTDDPITVGTTPLTFQLLPVSAGGGGGGGIEAAWLWADAAARTSAEAGLTSADLGKLGRQNDTQTIYSVLYVLGAYHFIAVAGVPVTVDDNADVYAFPVTEMQTPPDGVSQPDPIVNPGTVLYSWLVPSHNLSDLTDVGVALDNLGLSGGGGGASVGYGLFADKPVAGNAGAIWTPSDGYNQWVDNGTDWVPLIGGMPISGLVAPPPAADWTVANLGASSGSLLDAGGMLLLTNVAHDTTDESTIAYVALPAEPYTIIARLSAPDPQWNYVYWGLVLRQNDGQSKYFGPIWNGSFSYAVAAASTLGVVTGFDGATVYSGGHSWFKIVDDGSTRKYYVALQSVVLNWQLVLSQAHNADIVPTQAGIFANARNGGGQTDDLTVLCQFWHVS